MFVFLFLCYGVRPAAIRPARHDRLYSAPGCSAQGGRGLAQGQARAGGTPPIFRLFGYAGTGKTTLARHIAEGVDGKVLFAAFTGKAALVMRSKGCERRLHHSQPDLQAARKRRGDPELRPVGRRAGLEGQAHRHRRMLDGRRRARPRPDVVRRAGAGARRSGATAADPGRRLLHRGRARRHADRGAPAGARTIRSSGCRWTSAPASVSSRAGTARREVVTRDDLDPQRVHRCRPGAGRAQRHAARLQHAPARAPRLCRRVARAGDKLVCLRNNQRKGLFNGGLWSVKETADDAARHHQDAAAAGRRLRRQAASRSRCGRNASPAASRRSNGRSASASTSSTTAMCSPCTRRRARSGTTWCCSTSPRCSPRAAQRWLYTGVTRAAKRLTVVM